MKKRRTTPLSGAELQVLDNLQRIWRSKKKELGLTQEKAAHAFGWSAQANVSQYLTGKITLGLETGLKFAKILEVAPSELNPEWGEHDHTHAPGAEHEASRGDFVEIPIYDAQLSAGSGAWADSGHVVDSMPFPRSWLNKNDLPCLGMVIAYAKGDSMHPTIKDEDTLLIDTNQTRPTAEQVFAFANGDSELRVKRFAKRIDGMWIIRSDSTDPAYRDEPISPQDVGGLHIIGRVVRVISGL